MWQCSAAPAINEQALFLCPSFDFLKFQLCWAPEHLASHSAANRPPQTILFHSSVGLLRGFPSWAKFTMGQQQVVVEQNSQHSIGWDWKQEKTRQQKATQTNNFPLSNVTGKIMVTSISWSTTQNCPFHGAEEWLAPPCWKTCQSSRASARNWLCLRELCLPNESSACKDWVFCSSKVQRNFVFRKFTRNRITCLIPPLNRLSQSLLVVTCKSDDFAMPHSRKTQCFQHSTLRMMKNRTSSWLVCSLLGPTKPSIGG